jgi:hypothetical protein
MADAARAAARVLLEYFRNPGRPRVEERGVRIPHFCVSIAPTFAAGRGFAHQAGGRRELPSARRVEQQRDLPVS